MKYISTLSLAVLAVVAVLTVTSDGSFEFSVKEIHLTKNIPKD